MKTKDKVIVGVISAAIVVSGVFGARALVKGHNETSTMPKVTKDIVVTQAKDESTTNKTVIEELSETTTLENETNKPTEKATDTTNISKPIQKDNAIKNSIPDVKSEPSSTTTTTTTAAYPTEADAQRMVKDLEAYAVSRGLIIDRSLNAENSSWNMSGGLSKGSDYSTELNRDKSMIDMMCSMSITRVNFTYWQDSGGYTVMPYYI